MAVSITVAVLDIGMTLGLAHSLAMHDRCDLLFCGSNVTLVVVAGRGGRRRARGLESMLVRNVGSGSPPAVGAAGLVGRRRQVDCPTA
jgi:hypothetical protein